jgi:hypothetical protein
MGDLFTCASLSDWIERMPKIDGQAAFPSVSSCLSENPTSNVG